MLPRRALTIIKPVPVPELGGDPIPHIKRRLHDAGFECDVAVTRPDLPADVIVRDVLASPPPPDLVIAAGGDGTHGPAGAALAGSGVRLALIPLGTFNNFARSLGIPRSIDAALDVALSGNVRTIDAGRVNGRIFFEVAGAGWDATLFPLGETLKRGNLAGAVSAARHLFGYRTGEIILRLDGAKQVASHTPAVVVSNGPYFGTSFAVAPMTRLDDGLLTVTLFEGFGKADLLAYFAAVAEGQPRPDSRVVSHRAALVDIVSPRGLPAHADGEPVGPLATPFEVIPRALDVVAPAELAATPRSTARWKVAGAIPAEDSSAVKTQAPAQTMRWRVPAAGQSSETAMTEQRPDQER